MVSRFFEENFPNFTKKFVEFIENNESFFVNMVPDFFEAYIIQIAFGFLLIALTFTHWLHSRHKETDSKKYQYGFYLGIICSLVLFMFLMLPLAFQGDF